MRAEMIQRRKYKGSTLAMYKNILNDGYTSYYVVVYDKSGTAIKKLYDVNNRR